VTLMMSAIGTKRTFQSTQLMSAFGGKADMEKLYITLGKSRHPTVRISRRTGASCRK
jgi:hypothetical protein